MPRLIRFFLIAFAVIPLVGASVAAEQLCIGQEVPPGPDGRMLGHLPYAEAPASALVPAPAGFALGMPCQVNRDAALDLARMLAAARASPEVGNRLRAISCFRSVARQRAVFCSQIGPKKRCANAAERARAVGPPGYSEHASGYAIDFGTRPSPGCPDVNPCFANTPAGRWLIAHAPEYGFELSFPPGNAQGVTWEPWHWRWVGASQGEAGADKARQLFARARANFPALPTTPDMALAQRMTGPVQINGVPVVAPLIVNGVPVPPPAPTPRIDPPPPFGGR